MCDLRLWQEQKLEVERSQWVVMLGKKERTVAPTGDRVRGKLAACSLRGERGAGLAGPRGESRREAEMAVRYVSPKVGQRFGIRDTSWRGSFE